MMGTYSRVGTLLKEVSRANLNILKDSLRPCPHRVLSALHMYGYDHLSSDLVSVVEDILHLWISLRISSLRFWQSSRLR